MIDRLLRDRELLTAAAKGAGIGGLIAYLVFYWAHAILPGLVVSLLEMVLIVPFGPLLMLRPGYTQYGIFLPEACLIWALVGALVGVRWHRLKHGEAAPWNRRKKTTASIVLLAICIVNAVVWGALLSIVGVSGLSADNITTDTGIWFPPSARVLGSNSWGLMRSYGLEAVLTINDRDYDLFLAMLRTRHIVSREAGDPDPGRFGWWRPDLVDDPVILSVVRTKPYWQDEETEIIIGRHQPDGKTTIYVQQTHT